MRQQSIETEEGKDTRVDVEEEIRMQVQSRPNVHGQGMHSVHGDDCSREETREKKKVEQSKSPSTRDAVLCWREGLKIGDRRISNRAGKFDIDCSKHRCQGVWKKDENNYYITHNTILHIKYY